MYNCFVFPLTILQVAQIKRKYNEMEDLGRQEASRQQRISHANEALAAAELELANLPAVEPPKDKIV